MKKKILYTLSTLALAHTMCLSIANAQTGLPMKDVLISQKPLINFNGFFASRSELQKFYKGAQSTSVWGEPQVGYLQALIQKMYEHGLEPSDYNIALADTLPAAQKELFYSSLYIKMISDVVTGKVNPVYFESTVRFKKKTMTDYSAFVNALKQSDVDSFLAAFEDQLPKSPHYQMLKSALAFYRTPEVKAIFAKPVAATDTASIQERLKELGYQGSNLKSVLTKFQSDHSMEITGTVGPKTIVALSMTAEQRENQIKMNLERLRWLSTKMGEKFIFVNLANQRMTVYDSSAVETGGVALKMKVQVGQEFRKTPLMVTNVIQVTLNPTWKAPENVIIKDLIPQIKDDPNYLETKHLRVYNLAGLELKQSDVDWSRLKLGNIPVKLVQDSGPFNTLGQVKFMLNNGDDIYMHDTEHKEMFPLTKRLKSSGCMRLEKPFDLAEFVLRPTNDWPMEKIMSSLATGAENEVSQPKDIKIGYQLPVYTMYLTTEIDESGKIIFLPDYYEQDLVLRNVLKTQHDENAQNNF